MQKDSVILVAGAHHLLKMAVLRELENQGYKHTAHGDASDACDYTNASEVKKLFQNIRPECVMFVGGPSGGIQANKQYPVDLMRDNLLAQTYVFQEAHQCGVEKLLFLASSCSYPKLCPQPMSVDALMTGELEPTSQAYGLAKLAGMTMCQAFRQQYGVQFIVGIPGDVFGPEDDFDLRTAHVIPALIHKMHCAKESQEPSVTVLGTGNPQREFMFSSDLARACIFIMEHYEGTEPINLGVGETYSIRDIAFLIRDVVGYEGQLVFDQSKPDGMPLKGLNSQPLSLLGWRKEVEIQSALEETYQGFLRKQLSLVGV